jgi:2-methylcitrate dehydratase PrpD
MSVADQYASFVYSTQFEDLPLESIEKAKELILDSVGCALGATQTEWGKAQLRYASELGGKSEATVVGSRTRISCAQAAFLNAQLANLLDFDDTHDVYSPGHPGCLIIPAALAVGEAIGATGEDLVTAIVLAYEVTMRVGRSLGSILWNVGLPSLANPIGPAMATAKLLGLDEESVRRALDVITLESGLGVGKPTRRKWDVSEALTLGSLKGNYGKSAQQGVEAVWLAKSGLTGIMGLLDLDFTAWYLLGLPAEGYELLTQGLGEQYRILEMSLKPTPSCRWSHVPVTAAWQALKGRPVKATDVSKIVVKGVERLQRYNWETMLDAQFSIPCTLALAISGEPPGPGWYITGRFRDPDIRELASRVVFERDAEAEALEIRQGKMTGAVDITFTDGRVQSSYAGHVKGAPENPLTQAEQLAKFKANASTLADEHITEVIKTIKTLDELEDVGCLVQGLRATSREGIKSRK